MKFDTVIHSGTVVTASETCKADVGIRDGRIVALAEHLAGGTVALTPGDVW